MKIEGDAELLRIFVGENDRWEGKPLYEAIVRAAREQGLAGATALRGIEGFGASNRIHTVKVLHLSEALPIVIEVIDRPDRIAAFLPVLDEMISEGLVTIEKVRYFMYRHDGAPTESADEEIQLESTEEAAPRVEPTSKIELTESARKLLADAKQAAADSRRVYVDSIDVLLVMLCESKGIAGRSLSTLGLECELVERSLRDEVSRDEPSAEFITALEAKSIAETRWLGHDHIGTEHLLLALCQIRPSAATDILMRLGAQPRDICKEVLAELGHRNDWQGWLADHPDM